MCVHSHNENPGLCQYFALGKFIAHAPPGYNEQRLLSDAKHYPNKTVSRCLGRGWKLDYPVEAYAVHGDDNIGICLFLGYLSESGKMLPVMK
jgi:hypothetical protein